MSSIVSRAPGPTPTRLVRFRALVRSPLSLPVAIIVVLFAIGAAVRPDFVSMGSIWGLLSVASLLAVVSVGQTIVIMSGNQGIDLSVGSVITLAALVTSNFSAGLDQNLPLALLAVVLVCALIGAINFVGVYLVGIYPLIMTLGMAFVLAGGAFAFAQDYGPTSPSPLLLAVGGAKLGPVPWLVLVAAVVFVAMTALLQWSRYGRQLYLVGANPRAARFAGIPVWRIYLLSYVLCSVLAGLTGVLVFGFAGSVNLSIGVPYTLMSIAAAVIGGTALTGGRGNIAGPFLGAIVFTVLANLLIVMGFGTADRQMMSGIVLVAILALTAREKAGRI
ncbi:MAG TPA: ABC transporter permease [Geminicoccus sp.]|uniref:ABC transporter permease n=1 Tax=Geminicoccus sp. TaxID=2024832 RepID=UPI002C6E46B6|nr:ABC transporter permease [Geminicoccus sp.]HWL68341.1 ABC transporter permease [Geminicoccus sp.]